MITRVAAFLQRDRRRHSALERSLLVSVWRNVQLGKSINAAGSLADVRNEERNAIASAAALVPCDCDLRVDCENKSNRMRIRGTPSMEHAKSRQDCY